VTDRELLELAAKSAGLLRKIAWVTQHDVGHTDQYLVDLPEHAHHFKWKHYPNNMWNPLTDDGDALRLAVKLSIDVYFGEDDGPATYAGWYGSEANTQRQRYAVERHNADPYAATRRAIVRAAAEIGKAMS
jgi:hypothetical protein